MKTATGSASSRDARGDQPDEEPTAATSAGRHALQALTPAECFDLLEPGGGRSSRSRTSAQTARTVTPLAAAFTAMAAVASGSMS